MNSLIEFVEKFIFGDVYHTLFSIKFEPRGKTQDQIKEIFHIVNFFFSLAKHPN